MRHGLDLAADLFLGAACPGCGAPGLAVCASCRAALDRRPVGPAVPDPEPAGFPRCASTGAYDDRVRALLVAAKEEQVLLVTPVLAGLLARAVAGLLDSTAAPGPVVLVPVPSAPAAVRRRGYDATDALARSAVRRLRAAGLPVRRVRALRLARRVADQSGLDAEARRQNLTGAYAARPWAGSGPAVVVDDLVTTGSSLVEAARALRAAGWPVLGAATVAATERRNTTLGVRCEGRTGPGLSGRRGLTSLHGEDATPEV